MALSAIGEGCHQQMEAILQEIISYVLLFCSDYVRGGACSSWVWSAGGVLSSFFSAASEGAVRRLQRHRSDGHRLRSDVSEEVPR